VTEQIRDYAEGDTLEENRGYHIDETYDRIRHSITEINMQLVVLAKFRPEQHVTVSNLLKEINHATCDVSLVLTYDLEVSLPTAHGICVDLTHVPAAVSLVYVLDMQVPGAVVIVRQRDARVLRDHIMMDREYGLCVHANPRHLQHN
jgi:hypothetical protein